MALKPGFEFDNEAPTRVKKADRGFAPEGLNVRPGSFGITQRVYTHVKTSRNDWTPKNVYASGLKNCARQQSMGIMGFTKAESDMQLANPQWNVVADFGTALHDLLEKWLKQLGIAVKSEYRVKHEVDGKVVLSGRVDSRVKVDDVELVLSTDDEDSVYEARIERNGREAILDVKTVSDKDFKEGAWGPKIPGYVAQISVYCHLEKVDTGIILLVNRNTGELLELEFTYDPIYAQKMLRRAKGVVDWAAQKRLPPAEEWAGAEGSFACKAFCPFYRQCKLEQTSLDDDGKGDVQRALDQGVNPATM